jgi:hypothetical protein
MIRRFLASLMLVSVCLAAVPVTAAAFNPFGGAVCSGQNHSSAACNASSNNPLAYDPNSGTDGLLIKITDIIAYLAGAIAIIMIIVGAIRLITSGSDVSTGSRTDTDVEDARRSIVSALVGLAIIVLAKSIITYVIKRL